MLFSGHIRAQLVLFHWLTFELVVGWLQVWRSFKWPPVCVCLDTHLKKIERFAPCVSRNADPMTNVNMPVAWTRRDPGPDSLLKVSFFRFYSARHKHSELVLCFWSGWPQSVSAPQKSRWRLSDLQRTCLNLRARTSCSRWNWTRTEWKWSGWGTTCRLSRETNTRWWARAKSTDCRSVRSDLGIRASTESSPKTKMPRPSWSWQVRDWSMCQTWMDC